LHSNRVSKAPVALKKALTASAQAALRCHATANPPAEPYRSQRLKIAALSLKIPPNVRGQLRLGRRTLNNRSLSRAKVRYSPTLISDERKEL
jgi:hypothetical protein